jgi:hypothetical protein
MKKFLVTLFILSLCGVANAECIGKVLSIETDPILRNVLVKTEYTLNGHVAEIGTTRYDPSHASETKIKSMIKKDIEVHCENLIERIVENTDFLREKIKEIEKNKSDSLAERLQGEVGKKSKKVKSKKIEYQGVTIELKDDKTQSVSDFTSTP